MITMTYKGVSSADKGLRILSMPTRTTGAARGETVEVAGRSGDLWIDGKAHNTYTREVRGSARQSMLDGIAAWLTGAGALTFSDMPNRSIDARIVDEIRFTRVSNDSDPLYRVEVTFTCQPYYNVTPEAATITVTTSNTNINNPYSAASAPRIKVYGTGDITLNVGATTVWLTDVSTAIILDSDLMDAFTADGSELANSQMDGDFPMLQPGSQRIRWSGTVTKVEITPRWRCI